MSVCVFICNYLYLHSHICILKKKIQLLMLLKYSKLTVGKRSLFKHSYKAAQARQAQAMYNGKNKGDFWRQPVSEFGWITESSILCFVGHAHAAKLRVYVMLHPAIGSPPCLCNCLGPSLSSLLPAVAVGPASTDTMASTHLAWCSQTQS